MLSIIKGALSIIFYPPAFIKELEKINKKYIVLFIILFLFIINGIIAANVQLKVMSRIGESDSLKIFAGGYIGYPLFSTIATVAGIYFFYFYYLFFMNIITGNRKDINTYVFISICYVSLLDWIHSMCRVIKSYNINIQEISNNLEYLGQIKLKIYLNDYISSIPSYLAGFADYFSLFHIWQGILLTYILKKIYKVSWSKSFIPVFVWWIVLYFVSSFYSLAL